ncbi:uncharacterized protein LOC107003834 [Solanum pennellii]|uniref:Uncharacterized protein LOC107003834 n=1 Tax=Solanum pennellii TaxID=28526 RepID=A0ABM1FJ29_SOLPN|nr:uncharacterized protein LOC107003834 [Solanum pennellii]
MLEMMKCHEESGSPYKPILRVGIGIEKSANFVDLTKMMPLGAESVLEKLSPSNTPILTVKGALEDVWASPSKAKSFVPKGPNKLILIVRGTHIPPVIIRPVYQLPMTNPKVVPWNYEPTLVTYKGKEIDEEIDEVGGITRSGRCYVPMELRKTKNDQIQIKSPVTEGEAEEFLRKMKLSDSSVVEQLRKTRAQISLLSLLIHSDEHHDELPKEGTGHNQSLHITVKCELSYVPRVLIDGGSGANICPLSTLQKLNVSAERVRPNNVCVRAFYGPKTDVIGEIELVLTIGPVDFAVNFQVLDINASYNLLLGRPWVIVHGEGDLSIYKDSSSPFIKADNESEALVYQAFEVVVVEHIPEGSVISKPNMPIASVIVVNELLKHGFEPGKGLGICLQGRAYPLSLQKSIGTFGLGYQPRVEDKMKAKKKKRDVWSLTKPIKPIYKSFIKARATESYQSSFPEPVMKVSEEMVNYFRDLFVEVDMVELGEGTSDRDVQFIGPDVKLNNWEVTPLPVKDESCSFYVDSSDMTCMHNFSPDLNIQSNLRPNIEIISQEIEYDEDRVFEEVRRDFNHFENKSNPNMSETETINLGDQEIIKETKISVHVRHQKDDTIQALFDYKDIFASSYDDMPGLRTDMVVHKLPIDPNFPPIKHKLRKLKTDMSIIIKEEITKQLEAKIIQVSQYPSWLANIVLVPKKDGKVRMCVDYRDLNKASPKYEFPLLNIHILLDSCAKHEVASVVDCYAGNHQIIMDDEDAEKTSFITPWGTYCYRVMPFVLKNAGATYMRAMTTMFHDMMHREIEVYVDDVIIKSKKQSNHVKDLRRFFERLRKYNLKLNPAKCVFGVPSGKLLGFIVSRRGIELDPSKIKAIQELPPPKNKLEVMSLLGRHIPRMHNEIADALATLSSMLQHPDDAHIDPLYIQIRDQHAYCNMIEEEFDGKPWFHDIKTYLQSGECP